MQRQIRDRWVSAASRVVLLLLLLSWLPAPAQAREVGPPGNGGERATGAIRADLPASFFVGVWETRNIEFGRDVHIVWIVRADGSLDYELTVDGVSFRGSIGTWEYRDGLMHEFWTRPDGSRGVGRASVERIDDVTLRLTIIDNGHDEYRGMVRVYRRRAPPQLSAVIPRP